MNEFFKSLVDPKGKFKLWGIAFLVLLGILLMILPGLFLQEPRDKPLSGEQQQIKLTDSVEYGASFLLELEKQLAEQAEEILNQGDGFGKVRVAVTLEAGPEQDIARNIQNQESVVEEKDSGGGTKVTSEVQEQVEYVFAQGRDEPLILREKSAEIKGVLVMAEGASDSVIKQQLSKAIQALFALPAHRVMILPMKGR